ncbi:hypothetical protein IEQ34_025257 [Dendrobium chrysotoxum]|uniref:Branched-chain-amino-acid aminotransferase n=1 Tax=Dendrobium chrysotoxum TaxID=161865 RepID=A0AAV7FRK1_DENCH|nr:hypothetical protein IEQ34_025257 [Dendrobium chrysotoxum]
MLLKRLGAHPGGAGQLSREASSSLTPAPRLRMTSNAFLRQCQHQQRAAYHSDPMTGEPMGPRDLDASLLVVEENKDRKAPPPSSTLVFGHSFSDHMLTAAWNSKTGWAPPAIHAYRPLTLDPSSVIFHYAPSLFEGMKAYKDVQGRLRLFRPDMNMKRLNNSAHRIALPPVNGKERMLHGVPSEPGYSLYIRPTLIGTQAALGVHPTNDALLFCIMSPVGPYFKGGFKPVALEADPTRVRAWPGGTGHYKLGGNYAPTLRPQMEAASHGYQQNLWLFGEDHKLTEVGTMNLFVVLQNEGGNGYEIVTPPLNGTILPGVTRDSILTLARDHYREIEGLPSAQELTVSEREITMGEVQQAGKDGRLLEIFGAGTAAVVSPVDRIGFQGQDIDIPVGPEGIGKVAKAMLNRMNDIQLGRIEHPWSVCIEDLL